MTQRDESFAIPDSVIPANATEVQLLSFVRTGTSPAGVFLVRTSTTKNNQTYPFYMGIQTYPQDAVSYNSMQDWYPIGATPNERNVTFFVPGDYPRSDWKIYACAYRV